MNAEPLHSRHFTVRIAAWLSDNAPLKAIREAVFIREQDVPVELEWDGEDESALHILALATDGTPVGTARILPDGHIGRVAVLNKWRGHGVGKRLMLFILQQAILRGDKSVFLDAQVEAIGFYEQFGFVAEGEVFMDAGIPHRHMTLSLDGSPHFE